MRPVLAALVVALAMAACGGAGTETPEGWVVHGSGELGYQMSHPAGWEASFDERTGEDVLIGADGEEIRISRFEDDEGWPADRIFLGAVRDFEALYGSQPVLVEQLELADGARVQVYQHRAPGRAGLEITQRAVVLADEDIWYVDWISTADEPGEPRELFVQLVRTFVPGPLLPDDVAA